MDIKYNDNYNHLKVSMDELNNEMERIKLVYYSLIKTIEK